MRSTPGQRRKMLIPNYVSVATELIPFFFYASARATGILVVSSSNDPPEGIRPGLRLHGA